MFAELDEKEKIVVLNAMKEDHFHEGDYVIKQGDDGNHLYVVESGELDCTKTFVSSIIGNTFIFLCRKKGMLLFS